jgi:hypothetical protein
LSEIVFSRTGGAMDRAEFAPLCGNAVKESVAALFDE